jgi:enoyl-CoA hydratase
MGYDTLLIEREGAVAIVKINGPPVNSLNVAAYADIYGVFCELEKDDSVNAIILTGAGQKAFAAGLDIKDVAGKSIPKYFEFGRTSRMTVDKVASVDKPTVAAMFGFVFGGGCEMALACDLRIAATDASIGCPEVNLGIIPGSGGTQRLTRLVGMTKAKEMLLLGDAVNGDEAYRIGLVNRSVPKERLMEEAMAVAKRLAEKPKVAVSLIKTSINMGADMALAAAISFENECFTVAYVSEDGREGMAAFAEKRKPNYRGK